MQNSSQRSRVYRADVVDTKQVLVAWQGRGNGVAGPGSGSVAVIEGREADARGEGGANGAEARPATATNRANMRMANFIFGNLSE